MQVTSVTPLDKRRYKILLDEEIVIVLYKGEVKRYQIEADGELEPEQYEEILHEILFKRARERVVFLLKSSDKTEKELRQKLKDGFYPQEAVDHAIAAVKNYHYIDDERYARQYVANGACRKSRRQLSYELQKKGIEQDLIADIMEETPVDEAQQIRDFLRKRRYDGENASIEEKKKIMAALGRKGFSYETISKVIGQFCDNDY
ncbi:regulatory protein RecX [Clostridium sp. MCC353]|uniref:regulatory protein RecX n=1 Tax=Clostridium sp. MCC353 TaxID=2592646 RepID=UPI001C032130|nr:RecX family transcriptional regulator [Clostridium sp. MCC353]MBT9775437.1 regulatory protein RecX [Clostridium sp. MCC353]